jgi:hypothetical protein
MHAMIRCLTESTMSETDSRARDHTAIISKFEEFLEANGFEPVYLSEISLRPACRKRRCAAAAMSISGWARSAISGCGA